MTTFIKPLYYVKHADGSFSVTEPQPNAAVAEERERWTTLPRLPTPRVLASGTIAGKRIELRGWHTDDIEIWERQHGLKFGA